MCLTIEFLVGMNIFLVGVGRLGSEVGGYCCALVVLSTYSSLQELVCSL